MRLFHGTSTEHLDQILANGIQPRSITGRPSNWENDVPTRTDLVWLTTAYAVYYAVEAAGEEHDPVLIEVDCKKLPDIFPDEDFIANLRSDGTHESWNVERAAIDPRDYEDLWSASLQRSGNISTSNVPPAAIQSHRVIPTEGNGLLLFNTGLDAIPTDVNYPDCGRFYHECLAAYFEHDLSDMPSVVDKLEEEHHRRMLGDDGFEEMQKLLENYRPKLK